MKESGSTLGINLSFVIAFAFFFPFPDFGTSVQISLTFSKTLQIIANRRFVHIAVSVECFYVTKKLVVVSYVNQYLKT